MLHICIFTFTEYTNLDVLFTCSSSASPRLSAGGVSFDALLTPCEQPIYYVGTNGDAKGDCLSAEKRCKTLAQVMNGISTSTFGKFGTVKITTSSFSNGEVELPGI
jgi:hypothetical protein